MFTLSFLVVALFFFDASFATTRFKQKRSPTQTLALEGLNTNAKRFAAGLPPLAPAKKWAATKVDIAKRQGASIVPRGHSEGNGAIEVYDAQHVRLGWISNQGNDNQRYHLSDDPSKGIVFSADLTSTGSEPVSFKQASTANTYLAALIKQGTTLTDTTGSTILAFSALVPYGPPQANDPSIPNTESETALWSHDASTGELNGLWTNQSPTPNVLLKLWYDNSDQTFYLTGQNAAAPTSGSNPVTFRFAPM